MAKPVEIVSISSLFPLFKDGQEAIAIQMAKFKFSDGAECGFSVVVQKGIYVIGSEAVYIQPDYCLPESELFSSFTAPGGDPKKSRLGRRNRIRATKFNFSNGEGQSPVYSNGILMPMAEVEAYLGKGIGASDALAEELGVTKYEEPETGGSGLAIDFPPFLYKTDEENICNIVDHVRHVISQGQELGISIKRDGSSFTGFFRLDGGDWSVGVCSRSQEKKLDQHYTAEYVDFSGNRFRRKKGEYGDQVWHCEATGETRKESELNGLTAVIKEHRDSWVELAKSSGLMERGLEYCKSNGVQLAFRGEIIGQGLKGSGNKLNPDSSQKQKLVLFGVDDLSGGYSVRLNGSSKHSLERICESLGLEYAKSVFATPATYEELCEICEGIFRSEKENGRVIEGVVVRTRYSNDLSCKYMHGEYDSKK